LGNSNKSFSWFLHLLKGLRVFSRQSQNFRLISIQPLEAVTRGTDGQSLSDKKYIEALSNPILKA